MSAAPVRQQHGLVRAPAQRATGTGRVSFKSGPGNKTKLDRLYQQGCAKVRLPKVYGSDAVEAVLINSSGGLTGGDKMQWDLSCAPDSHGVATTQACEKIYKSDEGVATVTTKIKVDEGARFDWLPQETILFDKARLARTLSVDLASDARFLAVEAVLLGRLAMGERVHSVEFKDHWMIRQNDKLIHADAIALEGDVTAFGENDAILSGHSAFASLCAIGPNDQESLDRQCEEVRSVLGCFPALRGGASAFSGKILARLTAPTGHELRAALIPIIDILRTGEPLPRVWTT